MGLLEELAKNRRLRITCPSCSESFPAKEAQLFDARRPLEGAALEKLKALQAELKEERAALKARQEKAPQKSRIAAETGNFGKIVEKIAPSLPGFALESADCRALFEPIDYIVFDGLAKRGAIDAVRFVDVKSEGARLTKRQKEIRATIEAGKVELIVEDEP